MTIKNQKREVPVLLLTGYLGSGKTTLLNRILSNKSGINFAVIVNDLGEVNIDAALIQKGGVVNQEDDSLMALQNGCICCTLKSDLVKQLLEIVDQDRFDYIVIEASGVCEPAPIAQTICSIPQVVQPQFLTNGIPRLDSIVTVVDALRMRDEFNAANDLMKPNLEEDDIENLIIQQVEFCNLILLNKAALVEPEELGRIRQILLALQPHAEIVECNFGDVPLEKLLETRAFDFEKVATSAAWIAEIEQAGREDLEDDHHDHHEEGHHEGEDHEHHEEEGHGHHHHHHHHHDEGEAEEYGISTLVYYRREPFSLTEFDQLVARLWPRGIIRAKGICYFANAPATRYLFAPAGKQVQLNNVGQWYATMPEDELQEMLAKDAVLRHDWDDYYGDRMQKIVFIGQKMDKEAITTLLDACIVPQN